MAWLNGWQSRKKITINNTGNGNTLNNYQVEVILTYEPNMQTDFDDIRFTDDDETTLIDFWLDNKTDSTSATFWVEIPSIGASSNKYIYAYYGKNDAISASDGSATFEVFEDFENISLDNPGTYQTTPTYDSSGQTAHPDVLYFPSGWNGYNYWMGNTPYPNSDNEYENPSILASNDGASWEVPSGLTNPIDGPPADHPSAWYADTDLVYNDDENKLWLYWKWHGGTRNQVLLSTSGDGVNWSSPTKVIDHDSDYGDLVSPAILKIGSNWYMWSYDEPEDKVALYTSADGLSWSFSQFVSFSPNLLGKKWHLDVIYDSNASEYWMLISTADPTIGASSNGNNAIFVCKSSDRVNWIAYRGGLIYKNPGAWDGNRVYRPTMLYDYSTDSMKIWYGAKSDAGAWHTGYITESDWSARVTALENFGFYKQEPNGLHSIVDTIAKRGSKSYYLEHPGGSPSNAQIDFTTGDEHYYEIDFYDDNSTSAGTLKMIYLGRDPGGSGNLFAVGVRVDSDATHYVKRDKNLDYTSTGIARSVGWHKFGILVHNDGDIDLFIDDSDAGTLSSQFNDVEWIRISVDETSYYVDSLRIRKFSDPEPSASVGSEESLTISTAGFLLLEMMQV